MSAPAPPTPNPAFAHPATDAQLSRAVKALEANGIHAVVAKDAGDAKRLVLELLPEGASVLDATSQTLSATGIAEAINSSSHHKSVRNALVALAKEGHKDEQRRTGAAPDIIVGSVHAVTEHGEVVVASATGSQLAPYAYGAGRVVWVVGTQKIVPDLEAAFRRIREYSFPLENERAQKVYGMGSSLSKMLVVSREFQAGRITLVFVPEKLGF